MRIAFKEWAVIVDALGAGEQILIFRKGGIAEGRAGFQVDHSEFLLFPTLFHQQRDAVLPAAQERFDRLLRQSASDRVEIKCFCRVADWRRVASLAFADRLRGQHVWNDQVLEERFAWGRDKGIFALAVRVFALPAPVTVPVVPAYGGCKSWVTLDHDILTDPARPVLDDEQFETKLTRFRSALAAVEPLAVE